MFNLWTDIGCAAGTVPFHASRLTIDGDDSAGAGSATLDEEREEQHIADDDLLGDEEDVDSQPRGRRTDKQAKAYDELKSERDRLKAENERKERELAALQERVAATEASRETREEVNQLVNSQLERARQRAREVVGEIKKLDKSDPNYAERVYEAMFTRVYEDQAQAAEEISRRTSSEVYGETRSQEEAKERARELALDELAEQGLPAEAFDLVEALAIRQRQTDPGWFKRTAHEEQIPALVSMVKERVMKTKRESQEFRDEKRRHREPMDGVIGEGSRGTRSARGREEDDRAEGPGSMLADLARLKKTQARNTQVMLRQADR